MGYGSDPPSHLAVIREKSTSTDRCFRGRLRRALPVTRQKMDWEKVSGYTLGADLTKARS